MSIGGTLTMPAIHAATMPTDELTPDGQYRKLLSINMPHHFIGGRPHMFHHTMSHNNVDNSYDLLRADSRLNNRLIFPSTKKTEGSGGTIPSENADLVEYVKNKCNGVFLHGHTVNNQSMYPSNQRPTMTQMLTSDARDGGTVKTQNLVAVRDGTFPATWYQTKESDRKHIRDEGVVAPIDDYAYKLYHFVDSVNEARATNFKTMGMWMDVDHMKIGNIPKITAKIKFKILPIVPYHEEGKEYIPYHNLVRHLKREIEQVDKPFMVARQ
jgi:hypothetical protein